MGTQRPDRRRATAPAETEADGRIELPGQIDHQHTPAVQSCPLACPPSCCWRCPVALPDAIANVMADWLRGGVVRPPFDVDEMTHAAERAFTLGQPVENGGLIVVPDIVALAGLANGLDLPDTWKLRRDDRRTAYVYRLPGRADAVSTAAESAAAAEMAVSS